MSAPGPVVPRTFEVEVENWKQLHDWLEERGSDFWFFRGQEMYRWGLTPKLARVIKNVGSSTLNNEAFEDSLIGIFKREAKPYLATVPAEDDLLGWLALMQHFQAPTRLLDWTLSPYIALYFAIESLNLTKDSAIWALDASVCAGMHMGNQIPRPWDHLGVLESGPERADDAGDHDREPSLQSLQNKRIRRAIRSKTRWPLPLVPEWIDARLAVQQAVFTLSGDVAFPLERLRYSRNWQLGKADRSIGDMEGRLKWMSVLDPNSVICKVRVPASAKREALRFLHKVGITPASLFPGLEGIGRSVAQAHYKYVPFADFLTGDAPGLPTRLNRPMTT